MGDAILCTPALRAIRQHYKASRIAFLANETVQQILSPGEFDDIWLQPQNKNPFAIAKMLKDYKFTHAILFKNSFASALATFLARIPSRIGYAREARGPLLTEILYPPRRHGKFKPVSMLDYYLAIASWLGANTTDRKLELQVDKKQTTKLRSKLPEVFNSAGLLVVIVPGGAFGQSKCWLSERFAQTADRLISKYNAKVVVSVSPAPVEKKIAKQICDSSRYELFNLAEKPISLGELKSLFSIADLVISNDTGPRHIALALQRKVITLFGPNDPAWTDTGCENEIQIFGDAPCAPCSKPICKKSQHLCMQAISVETVCDAAEKLLENKAIQPAGKHTQEFIQISKSFFTDPDYQQGLSELGLTSIDTVFSFNAGKNLTKNNLARFRSRLQFEIHSPSATVFLKRYDRPPIVTQLGNWLTAHRQVSFGFGDFDKANQLIALGINTPKTICYGQQWGKLFEKRSFIITEKIPQAQSLERKLPHYFDAPPTAENLKLRRGFIMQLAAFIRKFHNTNYRHRDLYLSHIFYSDDGNFNLIDLARAFKPIVLNERFRIKDIAQVYYSAPAKYFSRTDRLRFYFGYTSTKKLNKKDKAFIRKVINKTRQMERHDIKHGRTAPFTS
jgi:heptosyltransferase-2